MRRAWILLAIGLAIACEPTGEVRTPDPAPVTPAAELAFVDVDVFDGRAWIDDATVLVAGGRITAVGSDVAVPAGAERIDGAGASLVPGLIDAHVHVQDGDDPARALAFGVTTEIDMFTVPELAAALRESSPLRADVISAGTLATSAGGHGTEYGLAIPTIDKPEDAQAFVAARKKEGSAFLKIVYDDGAELGLAFRTIDRATLGALIEAAHAQHMRAVVHIGTQQDAADAIEAGADGLAHMFLDGPARAEVIEAARRRGVFVTDTLAVLSSMCDGTRGPALAEDPRIAPLLRTADLTHLHEQLRPPTGRPSCVHAFAGVAALHAAGVPILASTDAPNPGTVHGASLHDELALLVGAGLDPSAALAAATSAPAAAFGLDDRGRIEIGRRADLLLVRGDPRQDITALRDILGVWKDGHAFDREPLRRIAARDLAERTRMHELPAPDGLGAGLVSDFDDGTTTTRFGAGWQVSTDKLVGGSSTARLEVVPNAKRGKSGRSLRVQGRIDPAGAALPWAGAMFFPGKQALAPANLAKVTAIELRARGDGPLQVMVFSARSGAMPAMTQVDISADWSSHTVDLRAMVPDPYDITGIYFGAAPRAGEFTFAIDDVRVVLAP